MPQALHRDAEKNLKKVGVTLYYIVKLRQGSGKDQQGMAVKAKGLKASTLA